MTPAKKPSTPEPEQRVFILPGGNTMAFRLIPAGRFRMGSRGNFGNEEPVHWVTICRPFWMAETPVTQAQFAEWTTADGNVRDDCFDALVTQVMNALAKSLDSKHAS